MFKRIINGFRVLFNPKILQEKIDALNYEITVDEGIMIIGKKVVDEINLFKDTYPHDKALHKLIDEKNKVPTDAEGFKDLLRFKKEIEGKEVKSCGKCNNKYLFECNCE